MGMYDCLSNIGNPSVRDIWMQADFGRNNLESQLRCAKQNWNYRLQNKADHCLKLLVVVPNKSNAQKVGWFHVIEKLTLFCTKSPEATPALIEDKNVAFIHFLSAGILACINFLIAIMLDPLRSLSSVMASAIPALYDIVNILDEWTSKIFWAIKND